MSNIFNRLELQAFRAGVTPRTKESRAWFMNKAKNMRSINRQALIKEDPLVQRNALKNLSRTGLVGTMQMFFYDPKHKDKLPYYDLFPLIVVVGRLACGRWILWIELALSSSDPSSKDVGLVDGYCQHEGNR